MSTPGSATKEGYLYHAPAFPVEGYLVQRGDNTKRLQAILPHVEDWWHKEVLDVGCNVGFFSLHLALQGARVFGIDKDPHALALAASQAMEHGVEGATFGEPDHERRYCRKKDVVLALSVLPWIYATEPNPEAVVSDIFTAPIAFVEIPYPPDGRANVKGVWDDESCKAYLERWYPFVEKIYVSDDETDGVKRPRTLWKCWRPHDARPIYGSQAEVKFVGDRVVKRPRAGKQWSAKHEREMMLRMPTATPAVVTEGVPDDWLVTERVVGEPITRCRMSLKNLEAQFAALADLLKFVEVSHNDIRPANLVVVPNGTGIVKVLDFGWATELGKPRPEGVNPIYGGDSDTASFLKILEHYPSWQRAVDSVGTNSAKGVQE